MFKPFQKYTCKNYDNLSDNHKNKNYLSRPRVSISKLKNAISH